MALKINELGEFINDFDPYETDRKRIYANCSLRDKQVDMGAMRCPICHKHFRPTCNAQKYCSDKCRAQAKNIRDSKKRMGNLSTKTYDKQCAHCGKAFKAEHYQTKYCCDKCRNAAKVKRGREWYLKHKESI